MNFIRTHEKVNPEYYYYYADLLGMLIWQDMPQKYGAATDALKPYFLHDLKAMINGRFNHPSIIQWELFNERDCDGIYNESEVIDRKKPIFGIAKREDEAVYKISGRAHESIVEKGVNLSEAIREALKLSDLDALGGGHPPAAGTKVPIDKIDDFLNNINIVINKQIK